MNDYEKLGAFYLGKDYDLESKKLEDSLLLYDSKDLVTHAVCVGMTGSGKTGLCIGLLEEAAIDGIPSIIIDPKGDMSNLMLLFDGMTAEEFKPWVNEKEADKKALTKDEYASQQAKFWNDGINQWGQDKKRIKKIKETVEMTIFTPGSSAGRQVSLLSSFDVPPDAVLHDHELLMEQVTMTITGLLNLLKIEADPVQSKEHIFLSNLLKTLWLNGTSVSLSEFINYIQNPPFEKLGVFDLETFYSSKERFELSMKINNLLASPGFSHWLEGDPLDIDTFYFNQSGKPRVSIFSIAHLNETDRMFFVTMLLSKLLAWSRSQSGTTSLRALFYMDEIFGYFPPVANPPSKKPLLSLLKQARAFGLGIVLASQNPVDLDYKGLSNIGTWFIGRLQTQNDKERMLDGLSGVQGKSDFTFNRAEMSQLLSSLGKRVFLMNNVHDERQRVFHTRWVLSYLRGPLTRDQIKLLSHKNKKIEEHSKSGDVKKEVKLKKTSGKFSAVKPIIDPQINEYFLSPDFIDVSTDAVMYQPYQLSSAMVYFSDTKLGINTEKEVVLVRPFSKSGNQVSWKNAFSLPVDISELDALPDDDIPADYKALPGVAQDKKNYTGWKKAYKNWLYQNYTLDMMKLESIGLVSLPDETEREFRIRARLHAHEKRDQLIEKIRKRFSPKIQRLEERLHKATQRIEIEKEQAKQSKLQSAISIGSTILSAFMGKKSYSRGTLSRASTSMRNMSRVHKESKDVNRSKDNYKIIEERIQALEMQLQDEIDFIETSIAPADEAIVKHSVKPLKKNITVTAHGLIWLPNPEEYLFNQ